MKYTLELTINKPRTEVWRIFDDPTNMDKWQPSLLKIERREGMPGHPGSVAKLTFKNGEREYSLIEKVTHREEPEQLDGVYENEFADNVIRNMFSDSGNAATLWRVEVEFHFKTLVMKALGPLMKKRFAANTQRDMERFKKFVEKE